MKDSGGSAYALSSIYLPSLMYQTEGVAAIVTVTELRMETADILSTLENAPVICIQRNSEPEAAMMSIETYRKLTAELERQGTAIGAI